MSLRYNYRNLEDTGGNVPNHGTGIWSGTWNVSDSLRSNVQVVSHPMTYASGSLNIAGGTQAIRFKPGGDAVPLLRPFAAQTGTTYMSFLLEAPTSTRTGDASDDFFQFGFSGSTVTNVYASGGISGSGSTENFFARVGTSAGSPTTVAGGTVDTSATYFIVLKISKEFSTNYDRVAVYVNPTSDIEASQASVILAPSSGTSTTGLSSINNLLIRNARNESTDTYYLDRFTVGDTFSSVIPEPASLSLIAMGGIALLRRRRGA